VRLALGADPRAHHQAALAESLCWPRSAPRSACWWRTRSRGLLVALRHFGGAPGGASDLPLDLRVLSFTIAMATGTALLCGLAPAIRRGAAST